MEQDATAMAMMIMESRPSPLPLPPFPLSGDGILSGILMTLAARFVTEVNPVCGAADWRLGRRSKLGSVNA